VGFLRRLLGGVGSRGEPTADGQTAGESADKASAESADKASAETAARDGPMRAPTLDEIEAEERARELDLLRGEQERLDELVLRQQRYADRSWVPPAQGGSRRSDDADRADSD
jgi:hypothetical protein